MARSRKPAPRPLGGMRSLRPLTLALVLGGCTGDITEADQADPAGAPATEGGGPRPPGPAAVTPVTPTPPPPAPTVGPLPLRRLSRVEYQNTLADLLGVTGDVASAFAHDVLGATGFPEGGAMSGPDFERLMETMETVARDTVAQRLAAIAPCDVARTGEAACADAFVKTLGRRLFRHPLSPQEAADLRAVYDDARRKIGRTHPEALQAALFAMLMSPRFHYHHPLGDRAPTVKGDLVALDGYEIASRLSYLLWQSAPDDELFAAAERGELAGRAGVMAQAARMLADPRKGARVARGFVDAWMELGHLADRDEGPDAPIYLALRESMLRFAEDVVRGQDRTFTRFLTSPEAWVNEVTARVWGSEVGTVRGSDLRRVTLSSGRRAGVITHPAFLAAHYDSVLSTPVRRGRFVLERLASCRALPPPIADIPDPPPRGANDSVRQHLDAYTNQGACAGCHAHMNPYGFALGAFDRLGAFRERDEYGKPVDTRVTVPDIGGAPAEVLDGADLARRIAGSPGARACFAQQVYKYALRRPVTAEGDPALAELEGRFSATGHDIRELFLATTQLPGFFYRLPAADEVLR